MTIFDAATLLALAAFVVTACMLVADHGVRAVEVAVDAWMAL
jgi:hypothetical protein